MKPHAITHTHPSKPHAIVHIHPAKYGNGMGRVQVSRKTDRQKERKQRSAWLYLIICLSKVRTNSLYSYQILIWCIPTSHITIQRFHSFAQLVMWSQKASQLLRRTCSAGRCLVCLVEIVGMLLIRLEGRGAMAVYRPPESSWLCANTLIPSSVPLSATVTATTISYANRSFE